ncbi:hypothetical protein [Photobacterium sp. Hal280]|uniref:hypothetical protein n=1 Tax=Photobacterium sp. Hal280 TaxID=3035163 RepID=UPI00301E48FF
MVKRIGFIISCISVLLPLILWLVDQESNELHVELVSIDNLAPQLAGDSELKMLFDGKPVESPNIINITIRNKGSEPIKKSDFDSPITFVFEDKTKILKTSLKSTFPPSIPVELNNHENSVVVKPLLLNQEDTINLSIMVNGNPNSLSVFARVAKVAEVKLSEDTSKTTKKILVNTLLIFSMPVMTCIYIYSAFRCFSGELKSNVKYIFLWVASGTSAASLMAKLETSISFFDSSLTVPISAIFFILSTIVMKKLNLFNVEKNFI